MAKRKKVTTAGLLVKAVIYTPPQPRDNDYIRAAKSRMTTAARRAMNIHTAQSKLEMLLAANFDPADLFCTLQASVCIRNLLQIYVSLFILIIILDILV